MRFVKLLAIAGFSIGCITALPDEDIPPPPPPQTEDIAEQKPEPKYGPRRVRMRCEWGCPAMMPYVNIMPVFQVVDAVDTTDSLPDVVTPTDADVGVTSPGSCGDAYEFSTCCGNDVCEASESAFFCPGDCS